MMLTIKPGDPEDVRLDSGSRATVLMLLIINREESS
jgi:hypothetical protein